MKRSIAGLVLIASVMSVCAESVTGFIYQQDGKYWRVGKKGGSGDNVAVAIIPVGEADKVAPFNGKTVTITGDLDPASGFKKFKPGFRVEEVKE